MVLALIIVLALIFLLVIWILVIPIVITIDTDRHEYSIRLVGLLKAQPLWDERGLRLLINLPIYKFEVDLIKESVKEKKPKPELKKKTKNGPNWSRISAVLRSFMVEKFELSIDTDDYVLNALLVPACQLVNNKKLNMSVNFLGETRCILKVRNSLLRMGVNYLTTDSKIMNR